MINYFLNEKKGKILQENKMKNILKIYKKIKK